MHTIQIDMKTNQSSWEDAGWEDAVCDWEVVLPFKKEEDVNKNENENENENGNEHVGVPVIDWNWEEKLENRESADLEDLYAKPKNPNKIRGIKPYSHYTKRKATTQLASPTSTLITPNTPNTPSMTKLELNDLIIKNDMKAAEDTFSFI